MLSRNESQADTTSRWMYPAVAFTYLCAMLSSNEALQHVSYPTQVLGKSIKPVPVMLLGVIIARKRYHYAKYMAILLIVVGIMRLFIKMRSISINMRKKTTTIKRNRIVHAPG